MTIRIGNREVKKVYKGSTQVQKVYKGSTEVYSGLEPETISLLARMDVQPINSLKQLINTTIKGLKEDGVWQLADCMYIRGVHTSQAACLNWIKDAHNSTLVNSPTFIPKEGIKGNGGTSYINNNYTPSTESVNYQINSASFVVMNKTVGTVNNRYALGAQRTSTPNKLLVITFATAANETLYFNTTNTVSTCNLTNGSYLGYSRDGNYVQGYVDGSVSGSNTSSASVTTLVDLPIYEGANNVNGSASLHYDGMFSFSFYGGLLNSAKQAALYNRIKYFYDNLDISDEYDDDAYILFSRMTSEPTTALKNLINTTIANLKTTGVWNKLDVLYMFNVHDSQAASLNWKTQLVGNCTLINSPTFTPKVGFKGDGATNYLRLNYDPGQGIPYAPKHQLYNNSHGFMAASRPVSGAGGAYGLRRSDCYTQFSFIAGAADYFYTNVTGVNAIVINDIQAGSICHFNRTSSGGGTYCIDGVSTAYTKAAVNYVPYTTTGWHALGINNYNTPAYSTVELSNLFSGESFNDTEAAALYTILNYFNTNVGGTF